MMGIKERAFGPLPPVTLEDLVPPDHFYRHLERTLDLGFVRDLVRGTYADIGRPSIDPVVFFKLQLILFFEGLRSERQLMRVVADRLSLRWYLGYDLTEPLPDHSSLTRIRERYGLEVFRRFFEAIVEQCIARGVGVGARNSTSTPPRSRPTPRSTRSGPASPSRPTSAGLFAANGATMATDGDAGGRRVAGRRRATHPAPLPVALTDAAQAELGRATPPRGTTGSGRLGGPTATGRAAPTGARPISGSARPTPTPRRCRRGGRTHLGYQDHYVVDGGRARIILTALVTPAEVQENQPALDLLWRARFRWKLQPRQVTGDTKYGTAREHRRHRRRQRIRAYVPLSEAGQRPGHVRGHGLRLRRGSDTYRCPGSRRCASSPSATDHAAARSTQAPAGACRACALRAQCTTSPRGRRVGRHLDEEYLERVRGYHATEPYAKAMRKRKVWVEPLFAEAKDWHGLAAVPVAGVGEGQRRGAADRGGTEPEAVAELAAGAGARGRTGRPAWSSRPSGRG